MSMQSPMDIVRRGTRGPWITIGLVVVLLGVALHLWSARDRHGSLTDPLDRGDTGTVENFASDDPPDDPPLGGKWHLKVSGVRDPLPGAASPAGTRMVGVYVQVKNVWDHTAAMGVVGDLSVDRNL